MPTCARLRSECDEVLQERPQLWEHFRGARMFVTGGTGFVGRSLLEVLLFANEVHGLQAHVHLLTRDPRRFAAAAPHLAGDSAVTVHAGDVRTFGLPDGPFDFVVHGAMDADRAANRRDPSRMLSTVIDGTRRVLDFASGAGCRRLLLVGSGAVYRYHAVDDPGEQDDRLTAGDLIEATHAAAKRIAELQCMLHSRDGGCAAMLARGFAFVGPYLPLDRHFAIGNFIGDAVAGRSIAVLGDGTTIRSYMYSSDAVLWLLTILAEGAAGRAYNVGSDEPVSIGDLARRIAQRASPPVPVDIRGRAIAGCPVDRYVPCTARPREELGLRLTVPLDEAIDRTLRWHRDGGPAGRGAAHREQCT